jgi:hypothetical protein
VHRIAHFQPNQHKNLMSHLHIADGSGANRGRRDTDVPGGRSDHRLACLRGGRCPDFLPSRRGLGGCSNLLPAQFGMAAAPRVREVGELQEGVAVDTAPRCRGLEGGAAVGDRER